MTTSSTLTIKPTASMVFPVTGPTDGVLAAMTTAAVTGHPVVLTANTATATLLVDVMSSTSHTARAAGLVVRWEVFIEQPDRSDPAWWVTTPTVEAHGYVKGASQ